MTLLPIRGGLCSTACLMAGLLAGCARVAGPPGVEVGPPSSGPCPPTPQAAASVDLRTALLPPPGTQPVWIHLVEHRVTESPEAGRSVQELELELQASLKAGKTEPDGAVTATLQFDRIRLKMDSPDHPEETRTYDSQTDKPQKGSPLADLLTVVADARLDLRVSPNGRLIELRGLDPKWRAAGTIMAPPDLLAVQWLFRDMCMGELVAEALFLPMPASPVQPGDAWEFDVPANIPLMAQLTSRLRCTMDRQPADDKTSEAIVICGSGCIEPTEPALKNSPPAIRPFVESSSHTMTARLDPATSVFRQTSERRVRLGLTLAPPTGAERLRMSVDQTRKLAAGRGEPVDGR